MIIVVPSGLKDADGARTRSDQKEGGDDRDSFELIKNPNISEYYTFIQEFTVLLCTIGTDNRFGGCCMKMEHEQFVNTHYFQKN